ncbi:hypothetical protein GTA08_BOTSDO08411 [Neofusicoccum parvum]|nr:hypothetical protein GTA08_BOTSDO08411 [Neofusicoccum parvum]
MLSLYSCWKGGDARDSDASSGADDAQTCRPLLPPPAETAANQFQSPLFQLPAEVRAVVWEYAIGGELVHVEHSPTMRCHEPRQPTVPVSWAQLHREERLDCGKNWAQKDWLNHMNWHFTSSCCGKGAALPDGRVVPKGAILGLLLSCKRIYHEAFPLLYTRNTFDFKCPADFLCFTTSLPPALQDPLRRIHMRLDLSWYLPRPESRWDTPPPWAWYQTCRALRDMRSLEEVQLTVNPTRRAGVVEEALEALDGWKIDGSLVVEMYEGADELREILAAKQSAFEVQTLVPWNSCFVTFAS